jgi:hypothetical protein
MIILSVPDKIEINTDSNWPLLTGGRCLEVVVKASLTVYTNCNIHSNINFEILMNFIEQGEQISCVNTYPGLRNPAHGSVRVKRMDH